MPLDESLCEQAFVNIVQNAYDAMGARPAACCECRFGIARAAADAERACGSNVDGVEVRIEDTGPGIPLSCANRFSIRS